MGLKRLTMFLAAALAFNAGWGATSLPFYSPCEDLTGFTTFGDSGYTNEWSLTTFGAGTNANPAFSYVPGYRQNNNNWHADGILFTPELAIETGKAYKVSMVMGAWYTSSVSQPYVSQEVAAFSSPARNASKTLIGRQEAGEAYNSSKRPSYTYYFKGDASKPYIGFQNTGAGNVTRFSIDDIRIVEVDVLTPDIVTGLTGTVDGKNVTLSFTLPLTTVTNDPLQSIQSVRILRDGRVVKEFTDQTPGTPITYVDTVSAIGDATYTVICGNNGSYGESVTYIANVTGGTVAPTQNTDYSIDESKPAGYFGRNYNAYSQYVPGEGIKISWAYPLSSFNESAIPEGEDKTVATVTRLNDGKVLVEDSALGEVMDTDVDESLRDIYQYKVDLRRYTHSKTANSSIVSLNNPVPFMPSVSSSTLNEFTVIDADGDNTTWSVLTSGDAKYHEVTKWFSGSNSTRYTGDDWLITPGILLEKGKSYRLDTDVLCTNLIETPIQFMIAAGRSNTIEALTEEVVPMNKFKALTPQTYSAYYTPEETGNVFFGIRTKDSSGGLGVSRILLDEVSSDLPEAVEAINVAYSPTTAGKATISFTAPSKNIVGEDLEALTKIELYLNGELLETYQNPLPGSLLSRDISFAIGSQDVYKTIPYTAAGAGLATSASVMVLEPPYTNTFDSESDVTGFMVIDPQESGYTWSYMAINKAMRAYPDRDDGQDDYLITPPIHLEQGMFYKIDFNTWLATPDDSQYYNNQLEVLLGTAPTREALTTTVHEPFYVRGGFNSKALVKEWFTVPETGEYYLAWHSMSAPGLGQEIFLDDINISAKIPGIYPGAVTNLEVMPDPQGAISTTLKFNIPENDLLGNPLGEKVTKTEIYRDGILISTKLNQDPGTEVTLTDSSNLTEGVHLYTITNFGYDSSAREYVPTRDMDEVVYVGLNRPGRVGFVEAEENPDNYGEVTITWSKPETDINGFPLNTTDLTYTIGRYILDNVTGAQSEVVFEQNYVPVNDEYKFTYQVKTGADKQEFMRFFVRANTKAHASGVHTGTCAAGSGSPTVITVWHAIGQPFSLPYSDSFRNSNSEHGMLGSSYEGFAAWGYNTKNPITGVEPVDDDKGLCLMESEFAESGARLFSTRIALDKENPFVSLYLYNQKSGGTTDDNLFGISVREGSGEFEMVDRKSVDEWCDGAPGWQKVTIDLSDYAGKVIYLALEGTAINLRFIHVDKIIVDELPDVDVAAKTVTNARAYTGVEHTVNVTVKNNGSKTLSSAKVNLMLDGQSIDTAEITDLPAGEMRVVTFTNLMTREDLGIHKYSAEMSADGDADLLDNFAEGGEFSLDDNDFPTVRLLDARQELEAVNLTWQQPALPSEAQQITDDFENYASWATIYSGIGDYTLVDNDRLGVGGFEDDSILPGIPYGSKQSFTIWDFSQSEVGSYDNYFPHSGNKCLVSLYTVDSGYLGTTDDWLISPVLPGTAQTISFYAKSYSDQYPERFTVLYSKDGMDWDDFKDNQFEEETVSGTYTKFSYNLPEGTRYFMIRHYSRGGYFLFVDDLTYTPVGDETLLLSGYNVYRDGERMTENILNATSWIDNTAVAKQDYLYGVTAVYDRGESPAQEVSIRTTGIQNTRDNVSVTVEDKDIVISGAEGLDFYIADTAGLMITARKAEAITRVPVSSGIYVVNVAGKTFKIVVK